MLIIHKNRVAHLIAFDQLQNSPSMPSGHKAEKKYSEIYWITQELLQFSSSKPLSNNPKIIKTSENWLRNKWNCKIFSKIRHLSIIIVENLILNEVQRSWARCKAFIYINKLYWCRKTFMCAWKLLWCRNVATPFPRIKGAEKPCKQGNIIFNR